MHLVGLTCLLGLTAMTMFRTYALDRQIDAVRRQGGVSLAATGGSRRVAHPSAADQAIRRLQGQRLATLSSIVAVFILLNLGCRWIDSLAGWVTPPGLPRDTLVLSLLLVFGFVAFLPARYYSGQSSAGRVDRAGSAVMPYLVRQAEILGAGIVLGVPLLWGMLHLARAAQGSWSPYGPWWLYLWGVLAMALVLEPVLCGRTIIPWISVMMPVGRGVDDRLTALMKQLGFKTRGIYAWVPAAWARNMGILVLGFGSSRRIVIPANLLRSLSADEIAAFVAHDLGHGRAGHRKLQLIGRAIKLFVILGAFGWMTSQSRTQPGYGAVGDAPALSVFAELLVIHMVLNFLALVEHAVERHFEFRADSFVKGLLGPDALTRALIKRSVDGGHSPIPDPLYSLINDRVPTAASRIARLREISAVSMPLEPAEDAFPPIGQLSWAGRYGLLTFHGGDAVLDRAAVAEQPARPTRHATPKRNRRPKTSAGRPKQVHASLSTG